MSTPKHEQPALIFFQRVIANDRLGHAYALTGPESVNKTAFAIELSKALLCTKSPGVGCGACSACRRVEKQIHPDLHLLAPAAGKREIGIDAIRGDLIPTIALTPFEAPRKVFVIEKADAMTEEAADCLLKTLEEPPPKSVLFLLTESADQLQPTIRSRCQIVRLVPPVAEEVAKELLLARPKNLPPQQALALARLADADLQRAQAMLESGWREERDAMLAALRGRDAQAVAAVREQIESAAASAGRSLEAQRGAIRRKLLLLLLCCRDLIVGGLTGEGSLLLNADSAEGIAQAGAQRKGSGTATTTGQWQYLAEDLLEADDAVLANVNLGLLLDYLFRRLA